MRSQNVPRKKFGSTMNRKVILQALVECITRFWIIFIFLRLWKIGILTVFSNEIYSVLSCYLFVRCIGRKSDQTRPQPLDQRDSQHNTFLYLPFSLNLIMFSTADKRPFIQVIAKIRYKNRFYNSRKFYYYLYLLFCRTIQLSLGFRKGDWILRGARFLFTLLIGPIVLH